MIRVSLTHLTEYTYDRAVALSPHVIRLRPAPHTRTHIESYALSVSPEKQFLNWQQDPFANWQARLVFPEKTQKLSVRVNLVAHIKVYNPFDFFTEEYAERYPFQYETKLAHELQPYLKVSDPANELAEFAAGFRGDGLTMVDFLVGINQHVRQKVNYVIRMEPGVQSVGETLAKSSGSCRDSAFLLVQLLRHFGIAARFVSGYLIQLKADTVAAGSEAGPQTDFTDLHAWAEAFIPGAGWVGLDATSGLLAAEGHIPLAATPEPESAAAIHGFSEPCNSKLHFEMHVERISETPRVSKPYTEEVWQQILGLGEKIDKVLAKSDMRLSIGGEPTFVSATDRESRQWNFDALGEDKYRLSEALLEKLYGIYCKGGIILRSQGKWYPGEPLPRWSLDCFWLKDGTALWNNLKLLGISEIRPRPAVLQDAEAFIQALAKSLALPGDCMQPAYEDPAHYITAEAKLPPQFEKEITGNSFDEIERRRLLAVLDKGLGSPVGFCLPLKYNSTRGVWQSARIRFRRSFLSLIPGDSPLGLRLPLASITETVEVDAVEDPLVRKKHAVGVAGEVRDEPIRTFLCAEIRNEKLWVFLPPVNTLDEFVTLVGIAEKIAANLSLVLHLEGYEPPKDGRLGFFRITPDPGVIEVNLFPSSSMKEAAAKTQVIYDEAEKLGLTTDRYMLDGRPSATGGGNHITVGALNPADSPFLRRADLLASLVAYWQNHPALSYLFSGMFIGPTSQAPRIDEARDANLYEAEIALKELRRHEKHPPWQIDRTMRNVLVDITGNTHRTEISIDKLYAPGSATGRLGLVELRAFEMPPHYRMSVAQQFLVAALLLKFWKEPYRHELIRWGGSLRDKWLLPLYIEEDMRRVLSDLDRAGFGFRDYFFEPFYEFRFPLYGRYAYDGMQFELRMALEPWHVLGEEMVLGGVSRSVDSAVERVQLKVEGFDTTRFEIACNGFAVPLVQVSHLNCHVAGVVFKAWAPPFTLHPTIAVHAPLNFAVYDRLSKKYVAGFSYHVAHPGGRSYDTYPVNSYEAESRRLSRFSEQAVYPKHPPTRMLQDEYPHTLDLRWA